MKKYEFTGETMEFEGHTLHRIRYLRDVGRLTPKGTLGGWIESNKNLSHEGKCFVGNEAKVFGNAKVMNDAVVMDYAVLKDSAELRDESGVKDSSVVGADTIIGDDVIIEGCSHIFFYADEDYGRYNILNFTEIDGCDIEATGIIDNCELKNIKLEGLLELEHKRMIQRFKDED